MPPLVRELLGPHRRTLAVILVMTLMSLAAPWPLKVILDNVVGNHPARQWISWILPVMGGAPKRHLAEAAGVMTVLIALVAGAAAQMAVHVHTSP